MTPQAAAGYIRVSSVMGRSGDSFLSPDLQRERIQAWAAYRQTPVVAWYQDIDVSGRAGVQRPEFERLMRDAAAGLFGTVAVYKLTRFGRSLKEAAANLDALQKLRVGLVSVTEDLDTSTAGGRFMRNMLFAMAEFESERIGEEWEAVHDARRRKGIAHITRGVYGYRTEGGEVAGIERAQAPAVRGIFERRHGGESVGAIRQWLYAEGYRPLKGGDHFSPTSIGHILRNPLYAGLLKTRDGELVEGKHEPIISRDLWEQVQGLHTRTRRLARHRAGLAAGLIRCAECGYTMTSWHHQGVAYYRCASSQHSVECPKPSAIRRQRLDTYLEQTFLKRTRRLTLPRGGRTVRRAVRWEDKAARLEGERETVQRALDTLADQRFKLGSMGADEYERQTSRYLTELGRIAADLEEARSLAATEPPKVAEFYESWPRLPLEVRQRMLRRLIREVRVAPGRVGHQPPVSERVVIEWIA